MKTPLRYQVTEFDCGSVSLINSLTFLFERKDLPAELIKEISTYTLDCYDSHGNLGQKGTSREAVKYLFRWITDYAEKKDFKVKLKYLSGEDVTYDKIEKCLKSGGCVNLRTYQSQEHYVTLTGVDDDCIYLFDPYYRTNEEYANNKNIECFAENQFNFNRKVKKVQFLSERKTEFSLGPIPKREAVLFLKK
jgi:predicted double-glycine peptidase